MPCVCVLTFTFWITSSIFSSPIVTGIITVVSPPPFWASLTADWLARVSDGVVTPWAGVAPSETKPCSTNLPKSVPANPVIVEAKFLFACVCSFVKSIDLINCEFLSSIAYSWFSIALCKFSLVSA